MYLYFTNISYFNKFSSAEIHITLLEHAVNNSKPYIVILNNSVVKSCIGSIRIINDTPLIEIQLSLEMYAAIENVLLAIIAYRQYSNQFILCVPVN